MSQSRSSSCTDQQGISMIKPKDVEVENHARYLRMMANHIMEDLAIDETDFQQLVDGCVVALCVWPFCVFSCGVWSVCACVDSKRLRVQIQNVSVCTSKTPVSYVTRAFCQHTRRRFVSTHGGFQRATPDTPHNTQHTTHTTEHLYKFFLHEASNAWVKARALWHSG